MQLLQAGSLEAESSETSVAADEGMKGKGGDMAIDRKLFGVKRYDYGYRPWA